MDDERSLSASATPIADQTANEGHSFSLNIASHFAAPAPGNTLSFSATLPEGLSIDPHTGVISGIPTDADFGTNRITVTATDAHGISVSEAFNLVVGDTGPTATPIADQTANEGHSFSLNIASHFAAPAPGNTLSFSATLPEGLSIDPHTGVISGIPTDADFGTNRITVTATDAHGISVSEAFNLVVGDTGPTATPIADQTANEGHSFSLNIASHFAAPAPGNTLSFSATLPEGLSIDPHTGVISGIPTDADFGTNRITVTATDAHGISVSEAFNLVVGDTGPTATPIADQTANEGHSFSLNIASHFAAPAPGNTLSFSATLPEGLSIDPHTGVISGIPTDADFGTNRITVTATDAHGISVSEAFNLVVDNPGQTLFANRAYQAFVGTAGNDRIYIQSYGSTIDGGGGHDTFIENNTSHNYYNTIKESNGGSATVQAGVDNAFVGFGGNFSAATGVTTIDTNGHSGVTVGSNGGTLDLSHVAVIDSSGHDNGVNIEVRSYQSVTALQGDDTIALTNVYGSTIDGGGGHDTFIENNTSHNYYNTIKESNGGSATVQAGVDNAFVGFGGNFSAATGVTTIDTNGHSGVTVGSNGGTLDLSHVAVIDSSGHDNGVNIEVRSYQSVTALQGDDTIALTNVYGSTIDGGGGHDTFIENNTSHNYYNTIKESNGGSATVQAGVDNAFVGFGGNFSAATGVTTIDTNGHSGVTVGSNGGTLDLSHVAVIDSSGHDNGVNIEVRSYQSVTALQGDDTIALTNVYGSTIDGGGGHDTFIENNTSHNYYNTIKESNGGSATVQAGVDNAFVGFGGNFSAATGVTTIDTNGHSGVTVGSNGGTLDLSHVAVIDSSGHDNGVNIEVRSYQSVTALQGDDTIALTNVYGSTIDGGGGHDTFIENNTSHNYYNTIKESNGGSATVQAGVDNAFVGFGGNFSAATGVTTIDTNGHSGVTVGSNGGTLDLSHVAVIDSSGHDNGVNIEVRSYQSVTALQGDDTIALTNVYGSTIDGGGGHDTFIENNTSHNYYNTIKESNGGSATVQAGVDNAFVGFGGNFSAATGVTTIDTNGHSGVTVGSNGGTLDLSHVAVIDSSGHDNGVNIEVRSYQSVTALQGDDTIALTNVYGSTIDGGGGHDTFIENNTSHNYYNTIKESNGGSATVQAGVDNAFVGFGGNFSAATGVTTIDTNGHSGVTVGSNGGTLDLSHVAVIDSSGHDNGVNIEVRSYQSVTALQGDDTIALTNVYGSTIDGGGGHDTFIENNTSHNYYNTIKESNGGSATVQAGVDNAFIGLSGDLAKSGIREIDGGAHSGVTVAANSGSGLLDFSGINVNNATILTGDGNQTVLVGSGQMTIVAGNGNDLFLLSEHSGNVSILGNSSGSWTDTIDLHKLGSNDTFSVTLLDAHDNVVGGWTGLVANGPTATHDISIDASLHGVIQVQHSDGSANDTIAFQHVEHLKY